MRGMHVKPVLSIVKNQHEDLEGGMLLLSLKSIKDASVGIARSRAIEVKGSQCEDLCCPGMGTVGVPLRGLSAP